MLVQAMRCDRCGALFLDGDREWNFTHKAVDSKGEAVRIDFCPICIDSFNRWIREKGVEEE